MAVWLAPVRREIKFLLGFHENYVSYKHHNIVQWLLENPLSKEHFNSTRFHKSYILSVQRLQKYEQC